MSTLPPRLDREQVNQALSWADAQADSLMNGDLVHALAAEVRALRADLDTAQEAHAADLDELDRLRRRDAVVRSYLDREHSGTRTWAETCRDMFAELDGVDRQYASLQSAVPDEEDVSARLETTADLLDDAGWWSRAEDLRVLVQAWPNLPADVRTAVAAALAGGKP